MNSKKRLIISLIVMLILLLAYCAWFRISLNCATFEYTPPQAVERYFELVLNPHLVEDNELLRNSISDDAQKTLDNFPDFSCMPIEVSENMSSAAPYNVDITFPDGRFFSVILEYEEWPGKCPTIRKIPDETILENIQLIEVGHPYLPSETIFRFMELLYTAIEQGDDALVRRLASEEAIMELGIYVPSYEEILVYNLDNTDGEYVVVLNQQSDYVLVWIEYEPYPKGFDYRKMTDEQILESLYLVRAENR